MQQTNQWMGTPRAGRLIQWLYVYNTDIFTGDKWPRWALLDFVTPPNERSEDRTYVYFSFLVSNGMSPESASDFMLMIDANPLDTPIRVQPKRKLLKRLTSLVARATSGTLKTPKMKDMNLGYVPKEPGSN